MSSSSIKLKMTVQIDLKDFGESIEDKRLELGVSVAEVCRRIGIDRSTWYAWRNGLAPTIEHETYNAVSKVLGLESVENVAC